MESKIIFGQMLDYFRKQNNMTMEELGKRMGKTKSAVSRWISGDNYPKVDDIEKLTKIFNTDVETLVFGRNYEENDLIKIYDLLTEIRKRKVLNYAHHQLDEQNKPSIINNIEEEKMEYITENLYGRLSAGTGQQIFDNPIEEIEIPMVIIPSEPYDIMLKIVGDSMQPAFKDGEYVFIKLTKEIRNGQFAAIIVDGEAFIKKVYIEDNEMRLVSLNKKYDDIIVGEHSDVEVVGTVVL